MSGSACRKLPLAALVFVPVLVAQATPPTLPGSSPFRYNGAGFVTLGVGGCRHGVSNVSVSGGGDAFLWRGLTLGGDIGYYRFTNSSRPFGIASLNIGYNFADRNTPGRWEPFLAVGFPGVAFAGGATPALSAGGGVHYWFHRKVGLRTEFRATIVEDDALSMFRIGFSFR